MTNLVDHLKAPPRADQGAIDDLEFMISDWGRALAATGRHIRNQKSEIRNPSSRGLTLIEMLVALAVTLVMMAAVVNLFANMTGSIRNRRAAIEAGAQLRQVRQRLALDLQGATSQGLTWQDPAENQGYIEIVEGRWNDKNPSYLLDTLDDMDDPGADDIADGRNRELDPTTSLIPSSQKVDSSLGQVTDGRALGDWDDVLALTVRSESDPFVGKALNPATGQVVTVESPLAEVIWFANERRTKDVEPTPDAYDGMRTVYRRVLLIAPWLGPWPMGSKPLNISVHLDQSTTPNQWAANTLSDLTKRENRACHDLAEPFLYPLNRDQLLPAGVGVEAVALSNTLAFDVRVFDPGAPLYQGPGGVILEPVDLGWQAAAATTGAIPVGFGAYCDLGWAKVPGPVNNPNEPSANLLYPPGTDVSNPYEFPTSFPASTPRPLFHVPHQVGWHPRNPTMFTDEYRYFPTYCTWSYHYENDGIDQDDDLIVDQGTNGLDDDGANGVDDKGERETSPPYDTPLLGVKVLFRVYERDARQIREASVTHSFKP